MNKILLILLLSVSGYGFNLIGGESSLTGDLNGARVQDENASYLNPGGLGKVKYDSFSASASSLQILESSNYINNSSLSAISLETNSILSVKRFYNFVVGFGLVNNFSFEATAEDNSEGYNVTIDTTYENLSLFSSFAFKDSDWGLTLFVNRQNSIGKSEVVSEEPSSFSFISKSHNVDTINSLRMNLGYQKEFSNSWFVGLVFKSPDYLISGQR